MRRRTRAVTPHTRSTNRTKRKMRPSASHSRRKPKHSVQPSTQPNLPLHVQHHLPPPPLTAGRSDDEARSTSLSAALLLDADAAFAEACAGENVSLRVRGGCAAAAALAVLAMGGSRAGAAMSEKERRGCSSAGVERAAALLAAGDADTEDSAITLCGGRAVGTPPKDEPSTSDARAAGSSACAVSTACVWRCSANHSSKTGSPARAALPSPPPLRAAPPLTGAEARAAAAKGGRQL
jgi:hypothetical protein